MQVSNHHGTVENGVILQQSLFDYATLDMETRVVVQQKTEEIKTLMRRTAQDIIDIGSRLIEVKQRLGHGNFGVWLDSEFGWNRVTASKFMNVYRQFSNVQSSEHLRLSFETMAYLASPSTPEAARIESIERAGQGEPITHAKAKTITAWHKGFDGNYADDVIEVAERHGANPANLPTLQRLYEAGRDTFSEVAASGYVQPTGEDDAVHIGESAAAVNLAIEKKSRLHKQSAAQAKDMDSGYLPPYHGTSQSKPHVSQNSGNNEWYTPKHFIDSAKQVMGAIDLDPASSDIANKTVGAEHYFTADDDGLNQQWFGRVWMNPPYSQPLIGQFCKTLAASLASGDVSESIVLVNNATETAWFQDLFSVASCICFPRSRIRFLDPQGNPSGQPLQGQAIVYCGANRGAFIAEFSQYGKVLNG